VLFTADRKDRVLIVRGVDNGLEQSWSRGGARVVPSSVTVTVKDSTGALIVDGAAATVTEGIAKYTLLAADTADLSLANGWVVVWSAVLPDSAVAREFIAEAALVRYAIAPPASADDLYARQARLSPSHRSPMTRDLDLQAKLDDAWRELERRLYAGGRRPELVMSPAQFRAPHQLLTLALIFEDLRMSDWEQYNVAAEGYRGEFENAWDGLRFTYDANQGGMPDGEGAGPDLEGPEAGGSLWLGGRGP